MLDGGRKTAISGSNSGHLRHLAMCLAEHSLLDLFHSSEEGSLHVTYRESLVSNLIAILVLLYLSNSIESDTSHIFIFRESMHSRTVVLTCTISQ